MHEQGVGDAKDTASILVHVCSQHPSLIMTLLQFLLCFFCMHIIVWTSNQKTPVVSQYGLSSCVPGLAKHSITSESSKKTMCMHGKGI